VAESQIKEGVHERALFYGLRVGIGIGGFVGFGALVFFGGATGR